MVATTVLNDDDTLPAHWRAAAPVLMAVGATSILISLGLCYLASPENERIIGFKVFLHSYLANYIYCLTFCIGALFFVLITNLSRASWCASRDGGVVGRAVFACACHGIAYPQWIALSMEW
jgi:hypothetical protein